MAVVMSNLLDSEDRGLWPCRESNDPGCARTVYDSIKLYLWTSAVRSKLHNFNCFRSRLRVRHDVEEGAVLAQFALVVNEAQLPELFKKKLIRDRRVPTISTSVS